MHKEIVSDKQGIAIVILFIIGSSSIFVMGLEAEKDIWLATILAVILALPLALIYAQLHSIFPDKNLFDMMEVCFGKFFGKGMILLFTCFTFYWSADVLVNFGNFIKTIGLIDTPSIIPMLSLIILCTWGIKEGIEVLGRWSETLLIIPVLIILGTMVLLIPKMSINNIRPVLYNGIKPVIKGALHSFSFPFSQIVAFSMIFSNFKEKRSPYKIYTMGLLIGGLILLMTSLTNILVIGVNTAKITHYPSYATIARMNIGNILQRLEVIITIVFILGGFIKISILLLCTCKGITKIFKIKDYRFITIPISLLTINLSFFQYESVMHYSEFQKEIWLYFTFPFHVFFPMLIFIVGKIKKKKLFP